MTDARLDQSILDARMRVDNLPTSGRSLRLDADAAACAAVAARLKVDNVKSIAVQLMAMPIKGGAHVTGEIEAAITQACVVTFVPLTQEISAPIDRLFLSGKNPDEERSAGSELFVDLEGKDLPDYFTGPEIDFNDLLLEILSLEIDPFPRAPDAQLPTEGDDVADISPFSVLKGLKSTRD